MLKRLSGPLKVCISAGLLIFVLMRLGWQQVLAALTGADLRWLAVAAFFYVLGVVVRALRWRTLLRSLDAPPVSVARLSALYFVSFFFNVFLPTGVGGDVVRAAEITRRAGPGAASSVVVDRGIGMVATCLFALAALPFAHAPSSYAVPLALTATATVIGFAAAYWLFAARAVAALDALTRVLPFLKPVTANEKLRAAVQAFGLYRKRDLALALGISLLFTAANAMTYATLGSAAHISLPLPYYLLAAPVLALVLLVPIAFNGVGTLDVAYQIVFTPIGVAAAGIEAMALGYHVLNLLAAVTGGLLYLLMGTSEMLAKTVE